MLKHVRVHAYGVGSMGVAGGDGGGVVFSIFRRVM